MQCLQCFYLFVARQQQLKNSSGIGTGYGNIIPSLSQSGAPARGHYGGYGGDVGHSIIAQGQFWLSFEVTLINYMPREPKVSLSYL